MRILLFLLFFFFFFHFFHSVVAGLTHTIITIPPKKTHSLGRKGAKLVDLTRTLVDSVGFALCARICPLCSIVGLGRRRRGSLGPKHTDSSLGHRIALEMRLGSLLGLGRGLLLLLLGGLCSVGSALLELGVGVGRGVGRAVGGGKEKVKNNNNNILK
jgi:hypothetical protein